MNSLRRVQGFLDTYDAAVGSLKGSEARKQLDQSVEKATAHAIDQGTAVRDFAGTGLDAKHLATDLKSNQMTPMAKYARANLRGAADFNALATVPHGRQGHGLVLAARAMATAAQPYATKPGANPFLAESVTHISAAADALQASLDGRVTARSQRVVATAGVRKQLALGREAVAMLDAIVSKRLVGQTELLAGWRSAKRLKAKGGGVVAGPVVPVVPATPISPVTPVTVTAPAAKEVKIA